MDAKLQNKNKKLRNCGVFNYLIMLHLHANYYQPRFCPVSGLSEVCPVGIG